jgi:hypothetical protein
MAARAEALTVDTRPTKEVVVDSLTRDASVEACVFDLLDNAVDAARNAAYADHPGDEHPLLESYDGFVIELSFDAGGLRIKDNCGGIPADALSHVALRFGQRSSHRYGIGIFGVGLNRALFKLGGRSRIVTDTGTERSELELNIEDYISSADWEIPARRVATRGLRGTDIWIGSPSTDISRKFGDHDWVAARIADVSERYGRLIEKGLSISVNGTRVESGIPEIRENSPLAGERKFFRTGDDIGIYIEYGQHSGHRFRNEPDYDAEANKRLTGEYGWTVFCNDRAVLISDTSPVTGWDTKFHSEFYGFVGHVSFVSADPSRLPWNTTKTGVDFSNPAYQAALNDMRSFAENWRSLSNKRKKKATLPTIAPASSPRPSSSAGPPTPSVGPKPTSSPAAKPQPKAGPPSSAVKSPVIKPDHHEIRQILPPDVDEGHCKDKLLALVHEAKALDFIALPYAGLALIRMLFETAFTHFAIRTGRIDDVKTFGVDRREKRMERELTDDEKKKFTASVDEIIDYLDANPQVLGAGKAGHMSHSLKRFKNAQQTMNSAMHNPFQPIDRLVAIGLRTELVPLLRHLIESN